MGKRESKKVFQYLEEGNQISKGFNKDFKHNEHLDIHVEGYSSEKKIRYYTIGELGKILEINSETIRYYEKINLIPKPNKFENGYKKYSEIYIYRLKLIKKAKLFGFTLKEISNFFSDVLNKGDEELDLTNVVTNKINETEEKITKLKQKKELLIKFEEETKELNCPVLKKIINENKKNA